jgi:tetratricopeptide (TPR) repeat protein
MRKRFQKQPIPRRAPSVSSAKVQAALQNAVALHQRGLLVEAEQLCRNILKVAPNHFDATHLLGVVLLQRRQFVEGEQLIARALKINPNDPSALNNRGNALQMLKRPDKALASFDKAIALKPNHAEAFYNRGNALQELKRLDKALASYDKAIALKPDYAEAFNNRGVVLTQMGRLQEAKTAYLDALRINPNNVAAYVNFADLLSFVSGDPHLAAMEAFEQRREKLSKTERMLLDFALGKAYADLKDYRRSFAHLLKANASKRAMISYEEKSALALFDRIEAVFTPELIVAKSGGGVASSMPIFVLGMPRSGTTLVEQIIASHPKVHGAGELPTLNDVIRKYHGLDGNAISYPDFLRALDASALQRIGERYVASVRKIAPLSERVTDKAPGNFHFAGLIHLALPNAKIIHTIRDPMDTCISCFSRHFTNEQNATYDLGELGRYYKRYDRLMAHWRRVLPVGSILDVRYEDVVADLEGQARRIISYCGLPWDDRCLSFHETERPVYTASAVQVRRPIYKSAVGRWRAYEEYLGPLVHALG